jgi:hypothetical protein
MLRRSWKSGQERLHKVLHVIVGAVLFILVIGTWAYLWIPSSP